MVRTCNIMCQATLAALFCLLALAPARADVQQFQGAAVNADGELVFFEAHTIRFENHQIASMKTVYYDADMKRIGELISDFSQGSRVGSYDFIDERLQYKDGARVLSERILIYSKETPEADLQQKYIERESGQIVGQGFHPFIQENIDNLIKGEVLSAKLVLPAHMDQFNVRVYMKDSENGRMRVRIEMDNWFLRLFAPHVDAVYDINSRKLLSYQGVSVVADESGKTVPVTVSYTYSPSDPLVSSRMTTETSGQALH